MVGIGIRDKYGRYIFAKTVFRSSFVSFKGKSSRVSKGAISRGIVRLNFAEMQKYNPLFTKL